ncbi:hypothetical protein P692DRAFT_20851004 [Suillus brevipes Sb2]|nr:hypothetical protein P692DRAFT_20851004 [Suillus brevipes Sb2]
MPPPPILASTRAHPSTELHLHELSMATNEISVDMAHWLPTSPIAPSTPALSTDKRKASALGSDVDAPSGKCSRPPSATAKAQQEGTAVMSSLATTVETMSKNMSAPPPPPPPPPPSDFARAVELVSEATYLSTNDKLDMAQLFVKDKDEATAFLYLKGDDLKANWVQRKLAEICAMNID